MPEETQQDEIEWLREQVSRLTPEDRAFGCESGDLNDGYIVALLEAAETLLTAYDATHGA